MRAPADASFNVTAQLKANFEAVFEAYASTLAELEGLTSTVLELGPAMGDMRDAVHLKPLGEVSAGATVAASGSPPPSARQSHPRPAIAPCPAAGRRASGIEARGGGARVA